MRFFEKQFRIVFRGTVEIRIVVSRNLGMAAKIVAVTGLVIVVVVVVLLPFYGFSDSSCRFADSWGDVFLPRGPLLLFVVVVVVVVP